MQCKECKSTEITAMVAVIPIMPGATSYDMECECGHKWTKNRNHKRLGENRNWKNVKIVPNWFKRKQEEINAKITRGECPHCGGNLQTQEAGRNDQLIRTRTVCLSCNRLSLVSSISIEKT